MSKTKPIKEKKEKQEKTTKPVRLPRSVQQLIPVKRVFPDSIWQVGNNEFSQTWSFSDINYAVASLDDQRTILDSWGRVLNGLAADSRMKVTLVTTEYGVRPAAVKSSPGTKILTMAAFSGFASACMILFMTIFATYCPDIGSFLSGNNANLFSCNLYPASKSFLALTGSSSAISPTFSPNLSTILM